MMMKKIYAVAVCSMLSIGAYAQPSPPGVAVPPNTPGIASGPAQRAGEMRKDMRPEEGVNRRGGDMPKIAENGAIGTGKAAAAGERRADKREMRHPNRRAPKQGGTPK